MTSINDINDCDAFINAFSNITAAKLSFFGESLSSDELAVRPCLSQGYLGYEFENVQSLFKQNLTHHCHLTNELQKFIFHSPVSLVERCLMSIEDEKLFLSAAEAFANRCSQNERHLSNQFTNRFVDAIASIFARAELMEPKFSDKFEMEKITRRFAIPYEAVMQPFMEIVNAEKNKLTTEEPTNKADMSFLSQPTI